MYSPALMPPPKRRAEELTNPHPYYRIMQKETKLLAEHEWRETRANYYGMISEMDTCLGELFQFLKDSGEWEHTLILFTSDHGEYLGDHYLLDKAHFYDETMRVPLIIRDPYSQPQTNPKIGEGSPSRINGFCESIDLAPTILEFLGLPIPDRFQGTSLLPVVRGELPETGKGEIYFEADFRTRPSVPPTYHPDECLFWVVRDEKFKYVQFASADMPPILFDLQRDPGEFDNLAESSEYASVVAVYCQKLLRWRMRHEDQRMEHWAAIHRKR
jgi:arylsulfatase A-like enzyme